MCTAQVLVKIFWPRASAASRTKAPAAATTHRNQGLSSMGGQMTGTPELPSPWPGHRASAATCLLSARVPELTGGGMGPRWGGLEDRIRAQSKGTRGRRKSQPSQSTLMLPFLSSRLSQGLKGVSRETGKTSKHLKHLRGWGDGSVGTVAATQASKPEFGVPGPT